MSYKQKIHKEIKKALNGESDLVYLERTKLKEHGDVSTNIAMVLAKKQKRNPLDIANELKEKIKADGSLISHIEVAKPGFVNFVVGDYALSESLVEVINIGDKFGFAPEKSKEETLVEYVSANPTGDLHIGHGRQAVIGSCLVNLLSAAGYDVKSEFYINDFGEQIQNLSDTAWAIHCKLNGENVQWKEDFYPEDLLLPYVKKIVGAYCSKPQQQLTKEILGQEIKDLILKSQEELLSSLKISFDKWHSETDLHTRGEVKNTLKKLKESGITYEHEGAIWLKAQELGDVRDRVLVRSDGRSTYLLADVAYHINKFKRSTKLITLWGADHHGQEVGLKGALKVLKYDENKLEIIFVQMVSLKKEGQEIKMSKRAGTVVTVDEVLNEVGPDAFRYFLVESHPNHRMIFDIDLAKKQDKDNPVYYIQYAHARCCSIFRQITDDIKKEEVLKKCTISPDVFMYLFKANNQEYSATKSLILRILDFPEEVLNSAESRSPSRIANYLKELATDFHQFYTVCRVISKDINLTEARLGLVETVKITIANGLKILGINAPESM
ncbi:MAG: arginine--tRNA ligase [Candidatus Melainabacteria bacterium RIFCSPHIGHO2_02_FULL_34_12]|nr:MAG: arginine--tRNA ligase [Candidatus Melainabacteria bacterium RIFCSPHIGHO2_02_FULL_34_12]